MIVWQLFWTWFQKRIFLTVSRSYTNVVKSALCLIKLRISNVCFCIFIKLFTELFRHTTQVYRRRSDRWKRRNRFKKENESHRRLGDRARAAGLRRQQNKTDNNNATQRKRARASPSSLFPPDGPRRRRSRIHYTHRPERRRDRRRAYWTASAHARRRLNTRTGKVAGSAATGGAQAAFR